MCSAGYTGDGFSCADVDECAVTNGGCAANCQNLDGSFACYAAASCSDAAAHGVEDPDTLYVGGDPAKPWSVLCDAGAEYLSLPAGATQNFAQYTAGGGATGTSVRTSYDKLRIDPQTLKVDINDQRFATSQGSLVHPVLNATVLSMPFGVAMDCGGPSSQLGVARIDLSGTPFVVTSQFAIGGNNGAGTTTPMAGGRIVQVAGGGNCGWMAVVGTPFNPFNLSGARLVLQLAWSPEPTESSQ